MKAPQSAKLTRDLARLLVEHTDLHRQLAAVLRAKTQAVKSASLEALSDVSRQEQVIAQRIAEREGLRKKIMDALAVGRTAKGRWGRNLTLTELAKLVEPSESAALLAAAEPLRTAVAEAASAQRVASLVVGTLLMHVQWVVSAMRPKSVRSLAYAGDGRPVQVDDRALFETVG